MKLITLAGPPSCGKTSVLLKIIDELRELNVSCGVVKFDCLSSNDRNVYDAHGIPSLAGISYGRCPDHFFATNLPDVFDWGINQKLDVLFTESAGLCNRCSPYLDNALAICVVDVLAGMDAPAKMGPLLQHADIVAATKGDIVSQAEREVFSARLAGVARHAEIMQVNGLTGQGCTMLARAVMAAAETDKVVDAKLRFTMPSSLCSYCLGERRIGKEYQRGNVVSMFEDDLPVFPGENADGAAPVIVRSMDAPVVRPSLSGLSGSSGSSGSSPAHISTYKTPAYEGDAEELDLVASSEEIGQAQETLPVVKSITIYGGTDKDGKPAPLGDITICAGQVICLMGPTGAGKSRLLDDIECLAQADTPSGRNVLVNGGIPNKDDRYRFAGKLVAQLSQNMNYVIDMPVLKFLEMHARIRGIEDPYHIACKALERANRLSGERFSANTMLSQLSGGQSRSLMVADVALISAAPIILVDEIENAGLDKWEAMDLLTSQQKITVMSTHDPTLALMCDARMIIANGVVTQFIKNDGSESAVLKELHSIDQRLGELRTRLRAGQRVLS